MQLVRRFTAASLAVALSGLTAAVVPAQRRRTGAPPPSPPQRVGRPASPSAAARSALTGLYRLDAASSDDPRTIAERAATSFVFGDRARLVEELTARLSSPSRLAIQRQGQTIDIASTRAPRVTFIADGREQTERASDGHTVRTRAVLYGDQLTVTSTGAAEDDFSVNFDPVDGGRRLRVTRRIRSAELNRPLVVQSYYDRVSTVARFNIQGEPASVAAARRPPPAATTRRNPPPATAAGRQQAQSPPVIVRREPSRPAPTAAPDNLPVVPAGTRLAATLDTDLSTERAREGDRFTMTVREPAQLAGATLEGYVSRVEPAGRVRGRSSLAFGFERLRLRDGRTIEFVGVIESVRAGGEEVRVDVEGGGIEEGGNSQSDRTAQRVAIGAAVGAIIGAISGGGRGAAIGAAIGAGAGAGSVYIQGRDQLELPRGTEFTVRASGAPR